MQELDVMGTFWLPGQKRLAVFGRLIFDTNDGGTLHLADGLAEIMSNGELHETEFGKHGHVLGILNEPNYGRSVTLLDCLGLSRRKYVANAILFGAHFESDEDTVFDSGSVRFNDTGAWVGQDAITDDVALAVEGVDRREFVARLDRPPRAEAPFARGTVALDFRWSRTDVDHKSLTIEQWPQFEIEYGRKTPLREIVEDAGHIYNLMSLCTNRPGRFESVKLYRDDLPEKGHSGDPFPGTRQAIELKARLGDRTLPDDARVLTAHDVNVPFDDLGIAAVATWLELSPGILPIIGSLGTMLTRGIYDENRFLNIASAAEGLHRATIGGEYLPKKAFQRLRREIREHVPEEHHKWFNDVMAHANAPSLATRLTELSAELGDSIHSLVGSDVAAWIETVKRIRNDLTHLDEDRPTYEGGDLHYLAESLFDVTRLCLLLRTGLSPDSLPRIVHAIHMYDNLSKVERAIKRISPPPAQLTATVTSGDVGLDAWQPQ